MSNPELICQSAGSARHREIDNPCQRLRMTRSKVSSSRQVLQCMKRKYPSLLWQVLPQCGGRGPSTDCSCRAPGCLVCSSVSGPASDTRGASRFTLEPNTSAGKKWGALQKLGKNRSGDFRAWAVSFPRNCLQMDTKSPQAESSWKNRSSLKRYSRCHTG